MTDIKYNPINPDKFLDITKGTAYEVAVYGLEHLIEQDCQSKEENGNACLYDAGGGIMCIAAPCIRDKSRMVEREGWGSQVLNGAAPEDHEDLIECLQSVHDRLYQEDGFYAQLFGELQRHIGEMSESGEAYLHTLWESVLKLHERLSNE